ncbi:hypothetical protein Krac_9660 [Ktedonobacter racemifer DSM 44963]|uniref:Uncharacterized protein n=1 Tax=Ktedonobacter racemifer DSM 44963 TaxID=485913 RepID=D6TCX6_KTERA|nr:hypothetical protein Krac_9660 [Ktedonobacter racemifer DSM 44963]
MPLSFRLSVSLAFFSIIGRFKKVIIPLANNTIPARVPASLKGCVVRDALSSFHQLAFFALL